MELYIYHIGIPAHDCQITLIKHLLEIFTYISGMLTRPEVTRPRPRPEVTRPRPRPEVTRPRPRPEDTRQGQGQRSQGKAKAKARRHKAKAKTSRL